jgi:hypothetical protein
VQTVAAPNVSALKVVHLEIAIIERRESSLTDAALSFRALPNSLSLANHIVTFQEQMRFRAETDKRTRVKQQAVRAENFRSRNVFFESARHQRNA